MVPLGYAACHYKVVRTVRNVEYREKIGIDTNVPDFEMKKIDGNVMGAHLASFLEFLF